MNKILNGIAIAAFVLFAVVPIFADLIAEYAMFNL